MGVANILCSLLHLPQHPSQRFVTLQLAEQADTNSYVWKARSFPFTQLNNKPEPEYACPLLSIYDRTLDVPLAPEGRH